MWSCSHKITQNSFSLSLRAFTRRSIGDASEPFFSLMFIPFSAPQWWDVETGEALQTFFPTGSALKKIHVSSDFTTFVTIDSIGILYILRRVAWRRTALLCNLRTLRHSPAVTIFRDLHHECFKNVKPNDFRLSVPFCLHLLDRLSYSWACFILQVQLYQLGTARYRCHTCSLAVM